MRSVAVAVAVAGLMALGGVGLTSVALDARSPAAKEPREPSRLLVNADEWNLTLSRPKLPRGQAIVELRNRGEDDHDLRVQRMGKPRSVGIDRVEPGAGNRLSLKLRRGRRYVLYCSLPGHRELGMEARLKVAKKKRAR